MTDFKLIVDNKKINLLLLFLLVVGIYSISLAVLNIKKTSFYIFF